MIHNKHSFINSGIIGSIAAFFVYTYASTAFIFFFVFPLLSPERITNLYGYMLLISTTLLLATFLYFHIRINLKKNIELFLNHGNMLFKFIFFSTGFIVPVIAFALLIKYKPFETYLNFHLAVVLVFIISVPYIRLLHIFVSVFMIRLFYQTFDISSLLDEHGAIIVDLDNYLRLNSSVINQCIRMNIDLGVTAIKLNNYSEIESEFGKKYAKELSRQISYILKEQSRAYEKWGLLKKCRIYFCFSMVQNPDEYNNVLERFKNSFESQISIEGIKPVFEYYSSLEPCQNLPKSPLESDDNDFLHQQIYKLESAFGLRESLK
ncbi:MAG: hypothetical protein JXK07_02785 [Spirochaetes bacterium]|nr:hypothetical protein [Spirochaetota bacterium]MBN2771941.1 hypothetical protein [Spirochaetota bacterium]